MEHPTISDRDRSIHRLEEIVLDHLGIPRPGQAERQQVLQDQLLPNFSEAARQSWFAAVPTQQPVDCIYQNLHQTTEVAPEDIRILSEILEDAGVHEMLQELSTSPDVSQLQDLIPDPYEARLLKAVGHPHALTEAAALLRRAAHSPTLLSTPSDTLEKAAAASLEAHGRLTDFLMQPPPAAPPPASTPPSTGTGSDKEKPKKRKLFTGLGKLFSGLTLLTGNAIIIPTIVIGSLAAIPVMGSLAGGIVAVGDGIGQLRGEGE